MKNSISILFLAIFLSGTLSAQKIDYYNKSWKDIQAMAKAENRYILIDAYTDWCGWCKVMDKETMTDPKVVEFINKNFVPVKMEMEHGEGTMMAMKYHVSAFPTFMVFSLAGQYVYTITGYQKTEAFMKELNNALDLTQQFSAPGYVANVEPDFPQFYKDAFAENGKRKFPKDEEVEAFLDKQTDLFSEVSWGVIARFDGGDKYRKFFLNNVDKYAKLYGASTVTDKQNDVLYSYMEKAAKDKSETELNLSLALVDKYLKKDPEERKIFFRITYYTETREWGKQTAAIDDYVALDKYKNVDYMNTVSWGLFEKCDDQASLKKAVKWMEKVVKLEPKKYAYLDTYANLLFKTKNVKDAEAWANKAIEAGKISGDKTTSSEKLLEQIKKTK